MPDRLWILGASDPEMGAIEALLRECGERVVYALDATGQRVAPAGAYAPDCTWYSDDQPDPTGSDDVPGEDYELYCVECAPTARPHVTIDHHRAGDPGFGRPPAEFLASSSLGQVIAELARLDLLPISWRQHDWTPGAHYATATYVIAAYARARPATPTWIVGARREVPHDFVLTAAADHCLGAAYRGECPGVDPDALMRWRVESRAQHQGRSAEDILADIERAREALENARWIVLASQSELIDPGFDGAAQSEHWYDISVRDMRGAHVPELPEAGTRYGIAYVADGLPDRDGRVKTVCSGPPEVVRAFLRHWAPSQGLVDTYGDPARGFAGAYAVSP